MGDELREPLLTANCFGQLLKTRLFAEYYSAYSALEVLHIMRYINLLTYLFTYPHLLRSVPWQYMNCPTTQPTGRLDGQWPSIASERSQAASWSLRPYAALHCVWVFIGTARLVKPDASKVS